MRQLLEAPVVVGDVLLAPTVELAGLAELSSLRSTDDRLAALTRIAAAIQAEDEARTEIARLRRASRPVALPRRR